MWQSSEPQNMNLLDGLLRKSDGSLVQMNRNRRLAYYKIKVEKVLDIQKSPLCYTYDIMPPSASQQSTFEEQLKAKLPPLLMEQYFPKLLSNNESAPLDFSSERSFNQSINQPLPYPISLSPSKAKSMGFNLADVMDVQLRANKFVYDMNKQFSQRNESVFHNEEFESFADSVETKESQKN